MGGWWPPQRPLRSLNVSGSLWSASVEDLLSRTASADPTPGGGSIAAVTGAFGVGLLQMAVAVTDDSALDYCRLRLESLQELILPAADGDVQDFEALMSAFRLPRSDDAQRESRSRAVERTSIAATEGPLALAATLADALALSRELEPLVKQTIVSDVLAARDLIVGAARAAVRTADINLATLDRASSPAASELRTRRNAIVATLEETT